MEYFEFVYTDFFKENDDLGYEIEDKIPDYVTNIGLHAIKLDKSAYARVTIDILSKLSKHVIQFDRHQYSATRLAVRILMIGVYAIERNNVGLVDIVKEKIKELTIQHNSGKKIDKSMLKQEAQRQGDELQYDSFMDLVKDSPEVFLKKELSEDGWERNYLRFLDD